MRTRPLLLIISLLFLAACATNPVTGKKELMLMSKEQEIQFGESAYPAALWGELGGGGPYNDPALTSYLAGIVEDVHRVSQRPDVPMKFVIQNSSIPNAWALPGHVTITRGLLVNLQNEAQLAFVMGHEIGHVAARHSAEQYTRQVFRGAALGGTALAVGQQEGWLLNSIALGSGLVLLKFSRDDELLADKLGVQYMSRVGYKPEQAVNAHEQLVAAVNDYSSRMGKGTPEDNFLSNLLSDHPRTSVRIEEVRKIAEENPPAKLKGDGIDSAPFNNHLQAIRKINEGYKHYDKSLASYRNNDLPGAQRELDQAMAVDRKQPPFHNLQGLILLKDKKFAQSENSINEALRLDANYQPAWQSLGLVNYSQKRYNEAIGPLKKSLEMYPGNPVSSYILGLSYYSLKDYKNAIAPLETYRNAAPKDPDINGIIGICYEGTGDISNAYKNYELQVQVAPETDMGRLAAKRITELGPRMGR